MQTNVLLIHNDPKEVFFLESMIVKKSNFQVYTQKSIPDVHTRMSGVQLDVIVLVQSLKNQGVGVEELQKEWPNAKIVCIVLLLGYQHFVQKQQHIGGAMYFFTHVEGKEIQPWCASVLVPYLQEIHNGMHASVHSTSSATGEHSIIVIASSCGGPVALRQLISLLPSQLKTPILIAQHIPRLFDVSLCESLNGYTSKNVVLGRRGQRIEEDHIYLAPFDYHMKVVCHDEECFVQLEQTEKEHYLRPAADPLFRSVAPIFQERTIGVILTGMGEDGTAGSREIRHHGGRILCQDEATSISWGMPSSVVAENLHNHIAPIQEIGNRLWEWVAAQEASKH